jgi:putative hydrolase of the HAD superfamily
MGIAAVLWDIDDTLFDYSSAERAGILQHLTDEGLLGEFDSPEQALGLWNSDMGLAYERFLAGELSFLEHRRERVRLFLSHIDRTVSGSGAADAWFSRYKRCYEAHWSVFPDVLPVLDALQSRYAHGLLSNSSTAHQRVKLRRLGLQQRFRSLVCSDDIGAAKPAREAFHAGCRALGHPPEETVYVGDKLTTDALGARAAGLHAVWIDRPAEDPEPAPPGVHRIHTLADLPKVLDVIDFGAVPRIG